MGTQIPVGRGAVPPTITEGPAGTIYYSSARTHVSQDFRDCCAWCIGGGDGPTAGADAAGSDDDRLGGSKCPPGGDGAGAKPPEPDPCGGPHIQM